MKWKKKKKKKNRTLSGATTPGQSGPRSNGNKGVLRIPQHCWNLTIRLFSVISRTLVGRRVTLCRGAVSVFYSPSQGGYFCDVKTLIEAASNKSRLHLDQFIIL